MEKKEKELIYDRFGILLEDRKNKIPERSKKMKFDEEFHTKGRPEWIVDLYLELDKFISSLKTGIRREYLESYIKYSYRGLLFVYIIIRKGETLRLWAKVSYSSLGAVPLFVRDYEPVMRRIGVMIILDDQREFVANKSAILDVTFSIIKKALQGIADQKKRIKTPLKPITEVEPVKPIEIDRTSSVNISAGENGYLSKGRIQA
ncbi:unnamed protein product, partial [marine sediment metagenome]